MSGDWFVYWLKNADGDCIYVGVSECLDRRWKEHQRRLGDEIQGVASAGPFTKQQALAVEKNEQRRLAPKYVGSIKKLPSRFSTYAPDLPTFESEPLLPEDMAPLEIPDAADLDRRRKMRIIFDYFWPDTEATA